MGHGICQVAATSGVHSKIVAFEQEQSFLDSGNDRILKSIDTLVKKGKMTQEDATEAMGKIEFTTDVSALQDVDFLVEAVVENIDLKKDLYTTLGNVCKPGAIFASNTSSLSIREYFTLFLKSIIAAQRWRISVEDQTSFWGFTFSIPFRS